VSRATIVLEYVEPDTMSAKLPKCLVDSEGQRSTAMATPRLRHRNPLKLNGSVSRGQSTKHNVTNRCVLFLRDEICAVSVVHFPLMSVAVIAVHEALTGEPLLDFEKERQI